MRRRLSVDSFFSLLVLQLLIAMGLKTDLCETLEIEYPIIQAGMGRGTVNLAAAVANAGGLGTIGISETQASPQEVRDTLENNLEQLLEQTDGSFAMNVPVGSPGHSPDWYIDAVDAFIDGVLVNKLTNNDVANQLKLLETSGGSPERWIDDINEVKEETDLLHFQKVASVRHAEKAVELGVDGVTASGYEMGGHTHQPESAMHTFVLLPAVTEAVDVPVFASGGVRDGRSLIGALALGADAGYMGTRFIATQECDWHEDYKKYIVESTENDDTVIQGLIGPLRGLDTPGLADLEEAREEMDREEFIKYEDQKMTEARAYGDVEDGVVVAGQQSGYIDDMPTVDQLIEDIIGEAEETRRRLNSYQSSN